jgi:RecB family exonuclease
MKEFVRWSASQVDTFQSCHRKWWFNKILGLEIPQHPSAAIGSAVHAELEGYLTGEHGVDKLGPIARMALPFAPRPETVYVERAIEDLKLEAAGLPALGYIDVLNLRDDPPEVLDWKTTSSFQWAKTADDLLRNVQMTVYAKATHAMFDQLGLAPPEAVRVTHVALLTKAPHEARRTTALMDRATMEANWAHVERTVGEMKEVALAQTPDKVAPTKSSCSAYGGCPFRGRCQALDSTKDIKNPLSPFAGMGSCSTTTTEDTMNANKPAASALLARLGVKTKAATPTPAPTPDPVEPPAPVAVAPSTPPVVKVAPAPKAADALMARLRGSLAAPPVVPVATAPASTGSVGIVPPDAPSDEVLLSVITAPALAKPVKVEAPVVEAPVVEAPVAPSSSPAASAVRRPRNAAPRLQALGYPEADIAAMNNETMASILEAGTAYVAPVVEEAVVEEAFPVVEAPVEEKVETFTGIEYLADQGLPSSASTYEVGYDEGYKKGYQDAEEELTKKIRKEVEASIPAVAAPVGGLRLYIDCRPYVLGEARELADILAPLMAAVAEKAKVPHYSMIPYAQGPAQVAALLSVAPPTGIVLCDTRLPATAAVLEVLLPYASEVIRGIR